MRPQAPPRAAQREPVPRAQRGEQLREHDGRSQLRRDGRRRRLPLARPRAGVVGGDKEARAARNDELPVALVEARKRVVHLDHREAVARSVVVPRRAKIAFDVRRKVHEAHREAERLRQFSRDNTHFGRVFLHARLQLGQRILRPLILSTEAEVWRPRVECSGRSLRRDFDLLAQVGLSGGVFDAERHVAAKSARFAVIHALLCPFWQREEIACEAACLRHERRFNAVAYLKKSVVMARVTERLGKGVWIGAKLLDVEEWELDHIMECELVVWPVCRSAWSASVGALRVLYLISEVA